MPNLDHQSDLPPDRSHLSVNPANADDAAAKPLPRRRQLSNDQLAKGITAGDRAILGRAITLAESHKPQHQRQAEQLVTQLMPQTGNALRVGITGVPGVGKSTFIERLGVTLADDNHRVAVLAVDPSSSITGGSILGDKTRMAKLATHPNAFIRPSPSAGTLGGVAKKTRETLLLVEAAGYDIVLVETVGVGQSETVVAEMTDCFLALMLPNAGDELQGIKRGLLEVTDIIAVNKADADNITAAQHAAADLKRAMHVMPRKDNNWQVPVLTCSARTGDNLTEVWQTVTTRIHDLRNSGTLEKRRRKQALRWMWSLIEDQLLTTLKYDQHTQPLIQQMENEVTSGQRAPTAAARTVLDQFLHQHASPDNNS
ncbi:MAG: methylmalonyl Co-A mutase-associated GTPase MeaB [Phycisphaeraceae bacterium]